MFSQNEVVQVSCSSLHRSIRGTLRWTMGTWGWHSLLNLSPTCWMENFRKPQSFSEEVFDFHSISSTWHPASCWFPRTYAKQGVTSMKSNESENFFGETLRFSERFSKFSIQQVGESLASKIRRVSTPGSHGSWLEVFSSWLKVFSSWLKVFSSWLPAVTNDYLVVRVQSSIKYAAARNY